MVKVGVIVSFRLRRPITPGAGRVSPDDDRPTSQVEGKSFLLWLGCVEVANPADVWRQDRGRRKASFAPGLVPITPLA